MSTATAKLSSAVQSLIHERNFIAGQWSADGDGSFNTVLEKYQGVQLARVPHATEAQMEEAIAAAYASRATLRRLSAGERSSMLDALAHLLVEQQEAMALLIAHEAGKPIGYAKNEIARCIITVRTAAAEALRFTGETVPID